MLDRGMAWRCSKTLRMCSCLELVVQNANDTAKHEQRRERCQPATAALRSAVAGSDDPEFD